MARSHLVALLCAVSTCTVATATYAADLPARVAPVPVAPIFAAVPTWAGFYVGAHAGYGWGTKTFLDNFPVADLALDAHPSVSGGLGGLQAGYNFQRNWLVLGAQGDFAWSGVANRAFSCFPYGNQICSAHPEWISTVTGRVGAAFGPALFYAKGGLALVNDHFTNLATCSGSQPRSQGGVTAACGDPFVANQIRAGYAVGGGFEYRFAANWSVWAEYTYLDFGSHSVAFSDGRAGYFTEEIRQNLNKVTVGLNYRLGGFGGPAAFAAPGFLALAPGEAEDPTAPDKHVSVFAGVDVGKLSVDGYVGGLIAPFTDLDTSGIRVFVEGDSGAYKYFAGRQGINGLYEAGSALGGYGFEGDNYSVNLLVGAGAENDTLSRRDPTNSVVGTRFGGAVRGEVYYNPTPRTLLYTEDQYSTAFNTFYSESKAGYDVLGGAQFFVGPYVSFFGNDRFNQFRAGAHVSEIKLGPVSVDVTAGYADDSVVGVGAFGKLEVNTSF